MSVPIHDLNSCQKINFNSTNNQIALMSDSSQDYPPIYIHEEDISGYMINGDVVYVIKKPQV